MNLATSAAELNKSAQKYEKALLQLPSIGISEILPYMTGYPGVTYKQTIGEIFANSQLRPYTGDNNEIDTTDIKERTLETFLGSMVELFDPNQLKQTIWAQMKANSDGIKDSDMNKAMLFAIMDSVLSYLGPAVFSAVRDDAGTTTAKLFNGFDTIAATEITATKISAALGNYYAQTEAIDNTNAVDALREVYKKASPEMKAKKVNMMVDPDLLVAYEEDYLNVVGSTPYNAGFEQMYLMGTGKRWEIVPLVGKAGSQYITCSTKKNMIYGYGNGVANEGVEVRRGDNAFKLQFILAMFFGVQYATLDKKELMISKLFAG
ncbi:hypothetical protein [Mangrovibacterium sp.]|uniref:hypothetical protein n=1 Tax=Mangrovibacterium sp. TaxID=1961364 RepID=UPI0035695E1E